MLWVLRVFWMLRVSRVLGLVPFVRGLTHCCGLSVAGGNAGAVAQSKCAVEG